MDTLPSYVLIEITWNCNLSCRMCPRNICGYQMGTRTNMTYEDFIKIMDKIPSAKTVNMACCGEPLINPDFFKMIEYCAQNSKSVLMTTNGTMLTKENIDKIPSNLHLSMHVSIDSPVPGIYKELRGYNLEKVVENLKYLRRKRPDINLVIQPLLMKQTLKDIKNIIPLARNLTARLMPIYPIAFSKEDEERYVPFDMVDFNEKVIELHTLAAKFGVNVLPKPPQAFRKQCRDPWLGPTISIKGEIFPCCFSYEARSYDKTPDTWDEYYKGHCTKMPQGNYILGNIFKDDYAKLWNSDEYNKIRNTILEAERDVPKDYSKYRNSMELKNRFDYCKVCMWSWNQAC